MRYISLTCDPDRRLRRMPLGDLVRFQGAFKSLHEDQYAKLKRSIEDKGFFAPIFVWQNQILDGHQRLNVLERENWDIDGGVPVVEIEAENEKDAAEKLLLLSSTYGKVDAQGLYEFTAEKGVDLREFDLPDLPDFDVGEYLDEYHAEPKSEGDPDETPEPPAVPVTQAGDLWVMGDHRVLCGDCTDKGSWDRLRIGAGAVCVTSPPYNLGASSKLSGNKNHEKRGNAYIGHNDNQPAQAWRALIGQAHAYAAHFCDAAIFNLQPLAGNKRELIGWIADVEGLRDVLTWDKGHAAPQIAPGVVGSAYEWLVVTGSGNDTRVIPLSSWRGTIQSIYRGPRQTDNKYAEIHGATFPAHLPKWVMSELCNESAAAVDCFMGTGTTLIAAEETGRVCYGIEIAPQYVDVIVNRWQNHTGQAATLEGDGRTFAEIAEARGHDLPKTDEKGYGAAAG